MATTKLSAVRNDSTQRSDLDIIQPPTISHTPRSHSIYPNPFLKTKPPNTCSHSFLAHQSCLFNNFRPIDRCSAAHSQVDLPISASIGGLMAVAGFDIGAIREAVILGF